MEGKYLSEVIDLSRDIMPYEIIRIYSGVGSGKNYWVETLAKQGYNILLITSRRATAEAQAKKLEGKRWIDLEELSQTGADEQKKVIVTNAGIEQFSKKKYDSQNEDTHIWRFFDFIILDEAHSLTTDASFSDSPFHVKSFLDWVQSHNKTCKLIYMTGTPKPTDWLFGDEIKYSLKYKYHDFYMKCAHVDPEILLLYPSEGIEKAIAYEINAQGNKIIYFANSITRMEKMVPALIECGVKEDDIGVSYSNADNNPRDFPKSIKSRIKDIEESLAVHEVVPEQVKILITTSKNQEGININNDDIKIMFSEAQDRSALIQMAGRIRQKLDYLVILYDAQNHSKVFNNIDVDIDQNCVEAVNDVAKEYFEKYNFSQSKFEKFNETVYRKFPTIRYNYFEKKYCLYEGRIYGYKQETTDKNFLHACVKNWNSRINEPNSNNFYEWFPFSARGIYTAEELKNDFNELITNLIKKEGNLGGIITKDERDHLADSLRALIKEHRGGSDLNITFVNLGSILRKFGYELKDAKGYRKGEYYTINLKTGIK